MEVLLIFLLCRHFYKNLGRGSTSLDFDFNETREHGTTTYFKGAPKGSNIDSKGILPLIRLAIGPDSIKDETVVWFNEEATMNFDNRFDAAKWLSS